MVIKRQEKKHHNLPIYHNKIAGKTLKLGGFVFKATPDIQTTVWPGSVCDTDSHTAYPECAELCSLKQRQH